MTRRGNDADVEASKSSTRPKRQCRSEESPPVLGSPEYYIQPEDETDNLDAPISCGIWKVTSCVLLD